MAQKIIIANWKMNPQSLKEAEILFKGLSSFSKICKNTEIIICPPYPFLFIFNKIKSQTKNIKLGSQNVFYEKEGAYTGEISLEILKNFKVSYVIVGHSECRARGESNEIVNKKLLTILKSKIKPVLCIGESERDQNGNYLNFIENQIKECLLGVTKNQIKDIIFSYEPIWAIGKGAERQANPEEFIEVKIFIKKIISDLYEIKTAKEVKIIYGGSVNKENANTFIKNGEADGLLVGRDSLNVEKFKQIVLISG